MLWNTGFEVLGQQRIHIRGERARALTPEILLLDRIHARVLEIRRDREKKKWDRNMAKRSKNIINYCWYV